MASVCCYARYVRSSKPLSLLIGALMTLWLVGCGANAPARPELPASVAPDWTQTGMTHSEPPAQLDKTGAPDCWKATYSGPGTATVWTCVYQAEGNAFEAVQRTRAEANSVKFQEGQIFVLVQWDKAGRDEIATLIRGVQKALHKK